MAYEDDKGLYAPNHSICHFMIIFHVLLHNLIRSVLDFAYHQYGICRMYSEENLENPQRVDPVCQTPLPLAAI